jgi:hypothetical protein
MYINYYRAIRGAKDNTMQYVFPPSLLPSARPKRGEEHMRKGKLRAKRLYGKHNKIR